MKMAFIQSGGNIFTPWPSFINHFINWCKKLLQPNPTVNSFSDMLQTFQ